MRPLLTCLALAIALAGCSREKSFEERYGEIAHQIRASGEAIDAELDTRATEAAAGEAGMR